MYALHKSFDTPPASCVIWKYMSFAKFVRLLASQSLYFNRADQFEDEWECLLPVEHNTYFMSHRGMYNRYTKYVDCWHMNNGESDAMWKIYGDITGETVAICSTVGQLITALKKDRDHVQNIGCITYEGGSVPQSNLSYDLLYKRKAFSHEQELRCVTALNSNNHPDVSCELERLSSLGSNTSEKELRKSIGIKYIDIDVELRQLLQYVVMPPNSKPYFIDSVKYVTNGILPFDKIKHSKI